MNHQLLEKLNTFTTYTYKKGQVITRPEYEESIVYFILTGYVRAHTITEEGNEFSAAILGEGMYFPVFRYLPDYIYTRKLLTSYCYSALTETKVVSVNNKELNKILGAYPQLAKDLSEIYYLNIKTLESRMEFMVYTHAAYKKVCHFLLFLCKEFSKATSDGIEILPHFTNKEFATFIGLSRESVNHQLKVLREKKILEDSHESMYITDIQSLESELKG